jgi:histidinol-phosphatase (PHP family)
VPDEFYDRITEAAVSSGMAAELSSAGWRKPCRRGVPGATAAERLAAAGVPLTTASDAHRLEHVADHADLRALLTAVGVDALQGYTARTPRPVAVGVPPSAPHRPTAPNPPAAASA